MPKLGNVKATTRGEDSWPKGSTGSERNIGKRNDFHKGQRPESDLAKTRSRLDFTAACNAEDEDDDCENLMLVQFAAARYSGQVTTTDTTILVRDRDLLVRNRFLKRGRSTTVG